MYVYMYMVQFQGTKYRYRVLVTGYRVDGTGFVVERNMLFCYQAQPYQQLLFLLRSPIISAIAILVVQMSNIQVVVLSV